MTVNSEDDSDAGNDVITNRVTVGIQRGSRKWIGVISAVATAAAACGAAVLLLTETGASATDGLRGASASASPTPTAGTPTAGTPTAIPHTPHLMGTVTSSGSSKILIKDRDGFTRTIIVSSATKYSDSLTATPTVGTKVAAEGTVDADGTSLDAATVLAPKVRPAGSAGGPGGGPEGGPGGHGRSGSGGQGGAGGLRPSGSPAAPPSATPSPSPAPATS